ncbi:hypothetical protein DRJ00_09465, partial [Candidatus Aerophobetes bacterium]
TTSIILNGKVPGDTFTGTFKVDSSVADGQGSFSFASGALVDQAGNSGNEITSGSTVVIDKTPPPPPTNLVATAISGGKIRLTWTASNPETDVKQYNIYRGTISGGEDYSSPIATVSAGTTIYIDGPLEDGMTYYYVVRAQDPAGNIEKNVNEASATVDSTSPSFLSITSDKSFYRNGDTVNLTIQLVNCEIGCTLTADFSNIDDQYEDGMESFIDWASDGVDNDGDTHIDEMDERGFYSILYTISPINKKDDGEYSVLITVTDMAGNSASSSTTLTLRNAVSTINISRVCIKYAKEIAYDLISSTNVDNPTVFAGGKIDEICLSAEIREEVELDESNSSIILYKVVEKKPYGLKTEKVPGISQIKSGAGEAELIFYPEPIFNPEVDEHAKDGLYWLGAKIADKEGNATEGNFYFVYDTTPPEIPEFSIASVNKGKITLSGSTRPDNLSDPQNVRVFVNGELTGEATADDSGKFTIEGIALNKGENLITIQAVDKAGNESGLSDPLKISYQPDRILSLAFRSSHILRSHSPTQPVSVVYSVSQPAEVTIHIFNLKGYIVKDWRKYVLPGEETIWNWYGDNMHGEKVNNGVYILKIVARANDGREDSVTKLVGVLR